MSILQRRAFWATCLGIFGLIVVSLDIYVVISTPDLWQMVPRALHYGTPSTPSQDNPSEPALVATETTPAPLHSADLSVAPATFSSAAPEPPDLSVPLQPKQIVQAFYAALQQGECLRASDFRPHLPMALCGTMTDVALQRIEIDESNRQRAVVFLDLSYTLHTADYGPEIQHLRGHMLLRHTAGRWRIVPGSYRSFAVPSPDTYLSQTVALLPGKARRPRSHTGSLPVAPETLLQRLWTPHELQGDPQDIRITRPSSVSGRPPAEVAPSLAYDMPRPRSLYAIRRVRPKGSRKVVALTFDLCERADEIAGYDAEIVNSLRQHGIPATFFAGGKWMQSHPEKAMQLMADPLFEIGNHGWTHRNLRVLTGPTLDNEIRWTQWQYAALRERLAARSAQQGVSPQEMADIPPRPLTLRFPYGTCSPEALQSVAEQGLQAIQWDVVSGDPVRNQTPAQMVTTVLRQTKPGSIIVFHANGRGYGTAAALPRLITELGARGFAFQKVSDLLQESETVEAPPECYELRPGDNRRYDTLVREETRR